jgi:hypothetical protein
MSLFTRVRAHRRKNGSAVRGHARRVNKRQPVSASAGLRGAVIGDTDEPKPQQQVSVKLWKGHNGTWASRLAQQVRRFTEAESRETRQYRPYAHEMAGRLPRQKQNAEVHTELRHSHCISSNFKAKSRVAINGVAEVNWVLRLDVKHEYGTLFLHPEVELAGRKFQYPVIVPGVNLRGAQMQGVQFRSFATFDDGDLRDANLSYTAHEKTSFRFTDLRDANLRKAQMSRCDLTGADLTGADLTDTTLPNDISGVDLSKEQFESLTKNLYGGLEQYTVKEASREDLVDAFGGDTEALTVAMWAGDIEVRERATNQVVVGEFNKDEHYVPCWELKRLRDERLSADTKNVAVEHHELRHP